MIPLEPPALPAPSVPRLLVSVSDEAEALAAVAAGADLIDAKDPEAGALGALSPARIATIVAAVAGRAATSAVAGEADTVAAFLEGLRVTGDCGAAMIKVALGPALAEETALADVRQGVSGDPRRIVAVLFAEEDIDLRLVPALAGVGFAGIMIDTRVKGGRRLPELIGMPRLAAFVAACRREGLLSGLAGSLRLTDIPALAPLGPTYLGFRGGLCAGGDRRARLDPSRVAEAARRLAAPALRPEPA